MCWWPILTITYSWRESNTDVLTSWTTISLVLPSPGQRWRRKKKIPWSIYGRVFCWVFQYSGLKRGYGSSLLRRRVFYSFLRNLFLFCYFFFYLVIWLVLYKWVGWTPQSFVSSRKNRAEVKQQNILNFLDEDEKAVCLLVH